MRVWGTISLDTNRGTVSINLKNGSYCVDHYTHGMKKFLDEEMQRLKEEEKNTLSNKEI